MNSGDERSMLEKTLWQRTREIAKQIIPEVGNQIKRARNEELKKIQTSIIQEFTERKVFQLGMEIQCPDCSIFSWYSVKGADYNLQCLKCLAEFSFPPISTEVRWSYRTLGSFSSPKQARGAYTVLLTLRFFSESIWLGGAVSPLMSFKAKNGNKEEMEADLALFFQASKFADSKPEVIFAECKSFNDFEETDVDKIGKLGKAFPGAVLVFATLKNP